MPSLVRMARWSRRFRCLPSRRASKLKPCLVSRARFGSSGWRRSNSLGVAAFPMGACSSPKSPAVCASRRTGNCRRRLVACRRSPTASANRSRAASSTSRWIRISRRTAKSISRSPKRRPKQSPTERDRDPRLAAPLDLTDNRAGGRRRGPRDARRQPAHRRQGDLASGRRRLSAGDTSAIASCSASDGTLFIISGDRMRFDPAQDLCEPRQGRADQRRRFDPEGQPSSASRRTPGHLELGPSQHALGRVPSRDRPAVGGRDGAAGRRRVEPDQRGANYGWPVVSDGNNYDKSPIPDQTTDRVPGARPKVDAGDLAVGRAFYHGALFPWRGDLLVGGLSTQAFDPVDPRGQSASQRRTHQHEAAYSGRAAGVGWRRCC